MSRINKYFSNDIPLFDKELIKRCISINDPTNRITIIELLNLLEAEKRVEYTSSIRRFIYSHDSSGNPLFGRVEGGYKRKIKKYIKKKGGLDSISPLIRTNDDIINTINNKDTKELIKIAEIKKDKIAEIEKNRITEIDKINKETNELIKKLEKELNDEIEKELKDEIEKELKD
jgi:hypothetical protein